jgi:hypothetical protein
MTSTYADHLRRHGFPGNRGDCWWPEGGRSGVTITELDVDARRADLLEAWLRKKRADILVVAMPDAGAPAGTGGAARADLAVARSRARDRARPRYGRPARGDPRRRAPRAGHGAGTVTGDPRVERGDLRASGDTCVLVCMGPSRARSATGRVSICAEQCSRAKTRQVGLAGLSHLLPGPCGAS